MLIERTKCIFHFTFFHILTLFYKNVTYIVNLFSILREIGNRIGNFSYIFSPYLHEPPLEFMTSFPPKPSVFRVGVSSVGVSSVGVSNVGVACVGLWPRSRVTWSYTSWSNRVQPSLGRTTGASIVIMQRMSPR